MKNAIFLLAVGITTMAAVKLAQNEIKNLVST
jgi:hypothetical protein